MEQSLDYVRDVYHCTQSFERENTAEHCTLRYLKVTPILQNHIPS